MKPNMRTYLSFGGGVNSTAMMLLLLDEGWEFESVYVDHGTDWPETREYVQMLRDKGYQITVLKPSVFGHGRNFDNLAEYCKDHTMIPFLSRRWCTTRFKINVILDYIQIPCFQLIGIDSSEAHRAKMSCNAGIENRFPLLEWEIDRKGCVDIIKAHGLPVPMKSGCFICLSGDTKIVTRDGSKAISTLVGKQSILVPREKSGWGDWVESEIRSFGKQSLVKVTLRRHRSKKTIHATKEHRWVTKLKNGCFSPFVYTKELKPGDIIPSCKASSILASKKAVKPSPFGIAHGFAFGDGTLERNSKRPMSLCLFGEKDKAVLPYFSMCDHREAIANKTSHVIYVYGIPRYFKEFPSLREHRGYLLGWLSGYFAADGHVSKKGQANIYSSNISNIMFFRDVCYVLGIQTSPITTKIHSGINGIPATLHSTNICTRDLPESFWLNEHHLSRIKDRHALDPKPKQEWIVESVEETDRIEEVYCAIVPGREMFVLEDGVITGNCPFQKRSQWKELRRVHPDLFCKAKRLEDAVVEKQRIKGKKPYYINKIPLDAVVSENQIDMWPDQKPPCNCGL